MPLSVAIQMDPIESINLATDSTFILGLEAQRRGHALYYYQPWQLGLYQNQVMANVREIAFAEGQEQHFRFLGEEQLLNLARMDVVLLRQDPPFDMAYITSCHMLEFLHSSTLVVNNPREVRNSPEKLFPPLWPQLMPPTLITRDPEQIKAFLDAEGDIVLKPLYMFGGAGVLRVKKGDGNLRALLEFYANTMKEPVIAQKFLPEVSEGDTRIILVEGEIKGAVRRVPQGSDIRSNLHVGGKAMKATITPRMKEICATIGPELKKRGLLFVGIDIIGDYLTEINVTSPTTLREINALEGIRLESAIWDAIEKRLHK